MDVEPEEKVKTWMEGLYISSKENRESAASRKNNKGAGKTFAWMFCLFLLVAHSWPWCAVN